MSETNEVFCTLLRKTKHFLTAKIVLIKCTHARCFEFLLFLNQRVLKYERGDFGDPYCSRLSWQNTIKCKIWGVNRN